MTTERQAAANRRNARKSTGPRSGAGKKRASRNSYYHGLTATMATSAERAERVEKLARKIAGDSKSTVILERARTAARAEFDLAQVWWLKIALIERVFLFGELERPKLFKSMRQVSAFFNAFDRGELNIPPTPVDAAATMPSEEADRLTEAVRRVLPELLKLSRYERRAASLLYRSLRALNKRAVAA
jgi:hypothetical protein